MGEDYDTSAHRHIIHKVQIDINGADTSNGFWRAGVFAIDAGGDITAVLGRSGTEGIDVDQRHTFVFPNPVEIPASQRIRILGSRVDNDGESGSGTRSAHLSRGDEETASPRESYDDAHLDFARIRHVRVNHAFPDVGDSTHDHAEDSVRGDIKIWYTVKLDHGNLVGDGQVNAAHLDSGSAALGDVATAQGDGTVVYAAPAGGGGGGGGPFMWPAVSVAETIDVASANIVYATAFALPPTGNAVEIFASAENGYVAYAKVPVAVLLTVTVLENGVAQSTAGRLSVPLGNNRRLQIGHNAAGMLTVGTNHSETTGDMILQVTGIMVTPP